MTPEQIEARFQRIEELLTATAESQRITAESQTRTEAIANSNARSIEATTNAATETRQDLARLVNIVSNFVEATNTRPRALEN